MLGLVAATARADVDPVLRAIWGANEKGYPDLVQNAALLVKSVIVSIANLLQQSSRSNRGYIRFVVGLIDSVVGRNARALEQLRSGSAPVAVEIRFPPNAARVADDILSEQMKSLKDGDTYDAISDLCSWSRGSLAALSEASVKAMNNGVKIRRIFNLYLDMSYGTNPMPADRVREILQKHVEVMKSSKGKYKVKVVGPKEMTGLPDYEATPIIEEMRNLHSGIFTLQLSDSKDLSNECVRFQVERRDLSVLSLSSDPEVTKEDKRRFELLWTVAKPLDVAVDQLFRYYAKMQRQHATDVLHDAIGTLDPEVRKIMGEELSEHVSLLRAMLTDLEFMVFDPVSSAEYYAEIIAANTQSAFNETLWLRDKTLQTLNGELSYVDATAIVKKLHGPASSRRLFFTRGASVLCEEEVELLNAYVEAGFEVRLLDRALVDPRHRVLMLVSEHSRFSLAGHVGLDEPVILSASNRRRDSLCADFEMLWSDRHTMPYSSVQMLQGEALKGKLEVRENT